MSEELHLFGTDLFGEPVKPPSAGVLADEFIVPPFSVLNARGGDWQDRKRAWLSMGIRGELGRGAGLTLSGNARRFDHYRVKEGTRSATDESGTSVFDPVLCELAYSWFCPDGGAILDPFAGGSVRGVVASLMGRRYIGIELSAKQVAANEEQAGEICPDASPLWIVGDSARELRDVPAESQDFVFSCPPYANLERYSDDPRDLSTMDYPDFLDAYRRIVSLAARCLAPNRFACFVVGDVRDKAGMYLDFPAATTAAFRDAGLALYNEAILVGVVGSLSMRVRRQFNAGRKLGKAHQNVLVFVKGDPRKAAGACGS